MVVQISSFIFNIGPKSTKFYFGAQRREH